MQIVLLLIGIVVGVIIGFLVGKQKTQATTLDTSELDKKIAGLETEKLLLKKDIEHATTEKENLRKDFENKKTELLKEKEFVLQNPDSLLFNRFNNSVLLDCFILFIIWNIGFL